jgi:hypothetical protein
MRLTDRPFLYDADALPDVVAAGHVETYGGVKNVVRFVEAVAGIDQARDVQIVRGPFLDFEKTALIRIDRIVGFFGGPLAGHYELSTPAVTQKGEPDATLGQAQFSSWEDGAAGN